MDFICNMKNDVKCTGGLPYLLAWSILSDQIIYIYIYIYILLSGQSTCFNIFLLDLKGSVFLVKLRLIWNTLPFKSNKKILKQVLSQKWGRYIHIKIKGTHFDQTTFFRLMDMLHQHTIYIYIYIYIYHHHHHHYQVTLLKWISLTLSYSTHPYHLSLPGGPLEYIQCPHIVVSKLLLIG